MSFKCSTCSARFRRDDHLRRHQLSHSEPRYSCAAPECGMQFHRRDAAKRHEKVHQSDGLKKRRKPRRGAFPCARIPKQGLGLGTPSTCHDHVSTASNSETEPLSSSTSAAATTGIRHESAILRDCPKCTALDMLCGSCVSPLFLATHLRESDWAAFQFCLQHFVRIHAEGFPFLHCSSWRVDWVKSGKVFAMAAVGGRWIAPYAELSRLCFQMAVDHLEESTASIRDAPYTERLDDSLHRRRIMIFETRILLIEYSVWSHDSELREWGLKTLANEAITMVPTLTNAITYKLPPRNWLEWVLLEESKRALWCFYCLVIKSRHFLHHPVSAPETITTMDLPCPDILFEAPNQQLWRERKDCCLYQSMGSPPFRKTFYQLMSVDLMCQPVVDEAAKYSSHILLCSLWDAFQNGTTIACNFTTMDAYLERDMSRFRLRADLSRALEHWKALFWRDPYDLWHSHRPDYKFNSVMLSVYIESQEWSCPGAHPLRPSYRRVAAQLALNILSSISFCGFLEVGARSPLYVERIAYFCTSGLALAMLAWLDEIDGHLNDDCLPSEDRVIYEKLLDCLKRVPGSSNLFGSGFKYPPANRVREAVVKVWVLVTGDGEWVGKLSRST